jgi:hypothetical protein
MTLGFASTVIAKCQPSIPTPAGEPIPPRCRPLGPRGNGPSGSARASPRENTEVAGFQQVGHLSSCANTLSWHVGLSERRACRNLRNQQCRRFAMSVATPPPLPRPVNARLPLAAFCRPWNRQPAVLVGSLPDSTAPLGLAFRRGHAEPEVPASLVPLSPTIASRDLGQPRQRWLRPLDAKRGLPPSLSKP